MEIERVSWFLGFLCFTDFRISKIYQDSTIVNSVCFWKPLGEGNCFGPKKIKTIQTYSIIFQKVFLNDLAYYVLKCSDLRKLSRFHHRKIVLFWKTLGEANCFGPKFCFVSTRCSILWLLNYRNFENRKFRKYPFYVVGIGTILAKIHSCFLINLGLTSKFQDSIWRFFWISRCPSFPPPLKKGCPSFPKLTKKWKYRMLRYEK